MHFIKMEGAGNDYVYVDLWREEVPDPSVTARRIADRHFGVGGDGLILIGPSEVADVRMRMFNADGGEAQMCGNGIRCVAKYVHDEGHVRHSPIRVETDAGILAIEVTTDTEGRVDRARVEMGRPELRRAYIPMNGEPSGKPAVEVPLSIEGCEVLLTAVSMGNPHAVIFVPDVGRWPVENVGRAIETNPIFPERINIEFVEVVDRGEVIQRTWERGSGETLACGTGACAVCVAGWLTGRTDRDILVRLLGGELRIRWRDDDLVEMEGPAREVFRGTWTT